MPRRMSRAPADAWHLPLMALAATLVTLAVTAASSAVVLRGGFGDPDDAMRLVEVRAWLAGQSWFDVSAHRLDPPLGASMHWSRLVDLPTAAVIRLSGPFTDTSAAERWARLAVPGLLLFGFFLGMARLATVLAGRDAVPLVLIGAVLCGPALVVFLPGRIGHHGPETLVFVLATASALEALDPARAWHAAVAGALVALGLAMSLETMPFLAALGAALVAAWVLAGARAADTLARFGLGFAVAAPCLFLATTAPSRWFAPVCDAFGAAYLGAGMIAALGIIALARATAWLGSPSQRAAAATLLAAVVLGFAATAYPTCLHSPFAGVDPLVREAWLDRVVESKPLSTFLRERPATGFAILMPMLLGLAGSLFAARRCRTIPGSRFAMVAILLIVGLVLGLWQVRVFTTAAPLALVGALPLALRVRHRLTTRWPLVAATASPLLVLPFTSTGWAMMLPDEAAGANARKAACLSPSALAPLAALPHGRAVAPIDLGSHLLVATKLDVFAAPYHRNNDGNRFMLDVFRAPPDQAKAMLAARDATYVVTCGDETASLAAGRPDGLAAALGAGRIPDFLSPIPLGGTPYRVFAVRPSR